MVGLGRVAEDLVEVTAALDLVGSGLVEAMAALGKVGQGSAEVRGHHIAHMEARKV